MIIIVPSRERPESMTPLIEAWAGTRHISRLFLAINESDPTVEQYRKILYDAPDWVSWVRLNASTMVDAVNRAVQSCLHYDVIGFMGDDHRPETPGWDVRFRDALLRRPGIVWGNDGIQGPMLPTHMAMSGKIVRKLGRLCPPGFKHLYVDNYWQRIGMAVGHTYLADVNITHHHPLAGKVKWDEGYLRVNAGDMYEHDRRAFNDYIAGGHMDTDIKMALEAVRD